jgi:hypothetical protein
MISSDAKCNRSKLFLSLTVFNVSLNNNSEIPYMVNLMNNCITVKNYSMNFRNRHALIALWLLYNKISTKQCSFDYKTEVTLVER